MSKQKRYIKEVNVNNNVYKRSTKPIIYNERQNLESHLIQSIPVFDNERNIMNKCALINNKQQKATRIISHNENTIKEVNIQQEIKNINQNILTNGYYNNINNNDININLITQNQINNNLIMSQNIISSQKNQIRVDKDQTKKK